MSSIRIFLLGALAALTVGCVGIPERGARQYRVTHTAVVDIPTGASSVAVWLPLPRRSEHQAMRALAVDAPAGTRQVMDDTGNRYLYYTSRGILPTSVAIRATFELTRREVLLDDLLEQPAAADEDVERWLAAPREGIDERVRTTAERLTRSDAAPRENARAIFEWLVSNVDHWVKAPLTSQASGIGSGTQAFNAGAGDSEDFHALFVALARAARIPARIVYGSLLNEEQGGLDVDDGVHAWAEFYDPAHGWIPVDAALADLYVDDFTVSIENAKYVRFSTALGYRGPADEQVNYYFGNLDERRIAWNTGRYPRPTPAPVSDAVRALPKGHVEIDGKPVAEGNGWTRRLVFRALD